MEVTSVEGARSHFVSIIQEYIDELGSPLRRNQKTIAESAGVSRSNLSRIMNEAKMPTAQEIFNICKAISYSNESTELIQRMHPGQTHLIIDDVLGTNTERNKYVEVDHEIYFQNERYFGILARAYSLAGIKKASVINDYGIDGSNRITELINSGLITEKNGILFGLKKTCQFAMNATKKMIRLSIDFHKNMRMGTNSNQAFFMTFHVNKKERTWMYTFIRTARQIIREITTEGKVSEKLKKDILELLNVDLNKNQLVENKNTQEEKKHVFLSTVFDDFDLPDGENKERIQ